MTDDARPPEEERPRDERPAATPEPSANRPPTPPPRTPTTTAVGSGGQGSNRTSLPYILIGIGLLVLLFNLGWWGDIFGSIVRVLQLWPVALIAVGADLLTKGRYRTIIIAAAVISGLILLFVWQRPGAGGAAEIREVNVALGEARSISLDLDTGVADVNLDSAPSSFSALSGEVSVGSRERVSVDWQERGGTVSIEVRSRSAGGPFGFLSWSGAGGERDWDLTLAEGVPVELDVDLGVGDVDLELAAVDLRGLRLDAGVGNATISLPHNSGYDVTVDGGVGDVTLVLPAGMPTRIAVDSGLGSVDVDDSFERDGDSYTNSAYRDGSAAAFIEIDAGVGQVRIETAP